LIELLLELERSVNFVIIYEKTKSPGTAIPIKALFLFPQIYGKGKGYHKDALCIYSQFQADINIKAKVELQ